MLRSVAKKTRKSLTLEVKLDIIHRLERGEKTNSIASHHGLTPSTVYYFEVSRLLRRLERNSFVKWGLPVLTPGSKVQKTQALG
ncbi:hypothetical protein E2C01_023573 [Portunus trituberculatus]|uniref:HTH psq-type domain-containing protein n=1 Tax=Portunus trituberculatus TaxID=210409 RepID=A0A5B7E8K1_PORTR|nr:hypothetical protein [Portunus trituberculatus]